MYLRKFNNKSRKEIFFLASLWVLIIPVLLTACGDAATPLPGGVALSSTATVASITTATPAAAATAAPTTPGPATAAVTVFEKTAAPLASKPASTVSPGNYHPVIRFSSDSVITGESITVSGEGYPANVKLNIQLGPQGGKVETDSATTTDSSGKFKSIVFFVTYPDGSVVKPGKSTVAVATEDGKVKAGATVTVVEGSAGRVSPVKLIQDFFTAFKADSQAALAYLGTNLQAQIKQGKTSLHLLLGVENVPESVSVSPVAGKDNIFDVYENFQGGKQYIQMEVAGDTNGKMKIINIVIPNPPPVLTSPTPGSTTQPGYVTYTSPVN